MAERAWTVADVMVEDVETVRPETPFKTIVEKLWTRGVSGLPVVDAGGAVVGVVSEADLLGKPEHPIGTEVEHWVRGLERLAATSDSGAVQAVLTDYRHALGRTAADVMTSEVVSVGPGASIQEAASLMHHRGLKRLPVVDAEGRLVGIVSRADLLKTFLRADESLGEDVRTVLGRILTDPETVTFQVADAVVTLEGEVASEPEAEAAVVGIEAIPGIVGVESRLSSDL